MAAVYSLVCWGGRTGKTVSISATTDVVTLTNHGLRNGAKLWPSGTLPAELNASTPVYARSTAANTFTLHTSAAGAIANTDQITFAGSSTYAAVVLKSDLVASPSTALAAYGLGDLSRWGAAGSERIYDGLVAWNSGRAGATSLDVEVCELGEAFTDIATAATLITIPSATIRIESKINGIRSPAFHFGVIDSGFIFYTTLDSASYVLRASTDSALFEGFTIKVQSTFYGSNILQIDKFGQSAVRMMVLGRGGYTTIGTQSNGILQTQPGQKIIQCVVCGCLFGIRITQYMAGLLVADNITTKCGTGMSAAGTTNVSGSFYGNLSVGNTTNWYSCSGFTNATQNFGLSGEAWVVGSGTRGTIAISDFTDYAGGDFRPALSTSPQVESGVDYYGALALDIADAVRPAYMGGASAYRDAGPYEYDHGYGPWPASATISLTSIVSGSRVLITKASDGTVLYNDVPGTSLSFNTSHIGEFNVVVRKATASPFYREFNASGTTVADQTTSIKCLQQLDE